MASRLSISLSIGGKRFAPAHQEIFVVDRHDNSDDQDDDSEPEPVMDTTLDNDNEMDTSARSTSMIEDSLEWHIQPVWSNDSFGAGQELLLQ